MSIADPQIFEVGWPVLSSLQYFKVERKKKLYTVREIDLGKYKGANFPSSARTLRFLDVDVLLAACIMPCRIGIKQAALDLQM